MCAVAGPPFSREFTPHMNGLAGYGGLGLGECGGLGGSGGDGGLGLGDGGLGLGGGGLGGGGGVRRATSAATAAVRPSISACELAKASTSALSCVCVFVCAAARLASCDCAKCCSSVVFSLVSASACTVWASEAKKEASSLVPSSKTPCSATSSARAVTLPPSAGASVMSPRALVSVELPFALVKRGKAWQVLCVARSESRRRESAVWKARRMLAAGCRERRVLALERSWPFQRGASSELRSFARRGSVTAG